MSKLIAEFQPANFDHIQAVIVEYFKAFGLYYTTNQAGKQSHTVKDYDGIDSLMGLAYTSSSSYAGLWICNGLYVTYNDHYNFECFALDAELNVWAVLWDKEENELQINMSERLEAFRGMNPLQRSISLCTVSGSVVILPPINGSPLPNYKEVREALINAGGKYKSNTFVFQGDAQPYIDRLLSGESVNIKKEFQFFETPQEIANFMVSKADLSPDKLVLEPSAGRGSIVKAILKNTPELCVHAFELMDANQSELKQIKDCILLGDDFLTAPNTNHYLSFDRIIANPPFTKNQDIDHVRKMWEVLKPGGRIVTCTSKHWEHSNNKKEKAFREWLQEIGATVHPIEAGAFKESGTMVGTNILVIDKPISPDPDTIEPELTPDEAIAIEDTQTHKHPGLADEVRKTLQFLADVDIKQTGAISQGTREAVDTQGMSIKEPQKPSGFFRESGSGIPAGYTKSDGKPSGYLTKHQVRAHNTPTAIQDRKAGRTNTALPAPQMYLFS